MPRFTEDALAIALGGVLLTVALIAVLVSGDASNPIKPYIAAPGGWGASPLEAFGARGIGVAVAGAVLLSLFSSASARRLAFALAFLGVFLLATLALTIGKQQTIAYYGLAYALWAIVIGLVIANTIGTPGWLRPALRTELYMKTGLVLLGAEVLLPRLLALGVPGMCVAWIVTPIVLCVTFWFGQRVLRIESPSLNMVVSADMSVCGVSAAIATAAACRAKKEELSLAIGMSMAFTVAMMLAMPPLVRAMGLPPEVGGAWIGGTIDSTGAVGAAGELLGGPDGDDTALVTATTIKMIQNILIGVVAFGVATYWVTVVERKPSTAPATLDATNEVGLIEIWRRFPKFILGFLGASVVFSLISELHPSGDAIVKSTISGATKKFRTWCFALAFVSIGLETNYRALRGVLRSGKPLALYACGQSLNVGLTLAMAWLMFGVLFPQSDKPAIAELKPPTVAATPAERLATAGVDPGALFYTDHPRWAEPTRQAD